MTLDWTLTLGGLGLCALIFAGALARANRPADPLNVRMVNYHWVAMLALVAIVVGLAHLVTLIAGAPITGRH